MILLHGSNRIIESPDLEAGNPNNDYGQGFYCTMDAELAGEWATYRAGGSFVNKYELDDEGLCILNLYDDKYSVLNWITILLEHRRFFVSDPIMLLGKEYLISRYHIDLLKYDMVVGYRADDSYFSFARDFIGNSLPLEGLEDAIRLGSLGCQQFIRSKKAFDRLVFLGAEEIDRPYYSGKRIARDTIARKDYVEIQRNHAFRGTFLKDIIGGDT